MVKNSSRTHCKIRKQTGLSEHQPKRTIQHVAMLVLLLRSLCQLQVNFVSVSSLSTDLRLTEQARHRCGGRKQTVLRRSGDGMPLKKSCHETSTDLHPQVSPRESPRHANRWQQRTASSRKGRRPRTRTDSKFFPVSLPRATLHTISRRSFKILLRVGA